MTLGSDQRRALVILAGTGPRGATETLMAAHGFSVELLAGLVRDGLASAEPQRVRSGGGGKVLEVARLRVTDAGRLALKS
jgi:hypothetical protein